jgi:hypothetical protein
LVAFGLSVAVLVCAPPLAARGWIDKSIVNDSVTLDVERDGSAVVAHELLLAMRGGPLSELAVEPVDADAEPLPEATVTRAHANHDAGLPIPLSIEKQGTRLVLRVEGIKGLRTGTYQFRFRYRTNLATAGRIHRGNAGATVEWSGASFPDGMDSARVVFRFPTSTSPPRLPSVAALGTAGLSDDSDGVFLSTFRRASDKDELEVVRPHVAKGEVVTWRVVADAGTFDVADVPHETPKSEPSPAAVHGPPRVEPRRAPFWAAVLGLAVLYAGLVFAKSRWLAEACRTKRVTPRPLLPLPAGVRAVLAGISAAGAAGLLFEGVPAIWAGVCLLACMAAATHLPPRIPLPLRGPGKWVPLEPSVAFDGGPPPPRLRARYLDAGSAVGFALFVLLLAGFVAAAIVVLHHSVYRGIALALGSAVLLPIFHTGRAAELPPDPVTAPRELLEWLFRELGKDGTVDVRPHGRLPDGRAEPDELRLFATPKRPLPGFVGLELGLDFHQGALGLLALPFVIVRVLEGSEGAEAMPKGLFWSRGRSADERVAVLRPKVPTRRLVRELSRDLLGRLSVAKDDSRRQPKKSAARSSGKASSTANAGTASSPAHAT